MKPITGPQICLLLKRNDWRLKRVRGSHHIYTKPGEVRTISVPVHGQQILKPGLALRIARDGKISW